MGSTRRWVGLAALAAMLGCQGAEEAPPAPPRWTDVTDAAGLPGLRAAAVSARDVDGDGRADLLVPSDPQSRRLSGGAWTPWTTPEVYRASEAGYTALGLAGRVSGAPLLDHVTATAVSDLDGDGRADLLLGGFAVVQVLRQVDDLRFVAVTHDLSGRTYGGVPVRSDAHVSHFTVADLDRDGRQDVFVAMRQQDQEFFGEYPAQSDVWLTGQGSGEEWTLADGSERVLPLLYCSTGLTYAATLIPRRALGAPDLIWVGVDRGRDCLFALGDDLSLTPLEVPGFPGDVFETATMGVDFHYLDDQGTVLVATSDIGRVPLYTISRAGAVTNVSGRVLLGERRHTSWGVVLDDADLDGVVDLTLAYGLEVSAPSGLLEGSDGQVTITYLNSLGHFRGLHDASGTLGFVEVGAAAGPLFTPGASGSDDLEALVAAADGPAGVDALRRDYYALVVLDRERDGCFDLVASPRRMLDQASLAAGPLRHDYLSEARVSVLQGHCPERGWIGFDLGDVPGALVVLEVASADGVTRRVQAVKAGAGVGAIGEAGLVRFGLGEAPPALRGATITYRDGAQVTLSADALAPGRYHPVSR